MPKKQRLKNFSKEDMRVHTLFREIVFRGRRKHIPKDKHSLWHKNVDIFSRKPLDQYKKMFFVEEASIYLKINILCGTRMLTFFQENPWINTNVVVDGLKEP